MITIEYYIFHPTGEFLILLACKETSSSMNKNVLKVLSRVGPSDVDYHGSFTI